MEAEAASFAGVDLGALSDEDLAAEVSRRHEALARWEEVYYRDFIPLAHGVRLFGQVYNDKVRPADPYEFVDLLSGSGLLSVSRNAILQELADRVAREATEPTDAIDDYLDRFGSGPGTPEAVRVRERARLVRLVSEMVREPEAGGGPSGGTSQPASFLAPKTQAADRSEDYLGRFQGEERRFQEELLDLARASYRLRDDDNVFLGRFQRLVAAALAELRAREGGLSSAGPPTARGRAGRQSPQPPRPRGPSRPLRWRPRPPHATRSDSWSANRPALAWPWAELEWPWAKTTSMPSSAERSWCGDSLDPTMTFVAPLAAAIVERRGGMLVHGAIIAREYGLPCVTGVPDATLEIHTGDLLTVDGFLGIVVVGGAPPGSGV